MAKKTATKKGSNLFALDHDAILDTVRDANAALLARTVSLAEAFDRMPVTLDTDDLVERARGFRAQIEAAARDLRLARLEDGRPFRDADATVKGFFAEPEQRMARIEREVRNRLTAVALRARPPPSNDAPQSIALGTTFDGRAVAQATPAPLPAHEAPAAASAIRLRWEIAHVDRATLDLEALRMFLTSAALEAACRKHLDENGPNTLPGVTYREVAVD